MYGTEPRIPAPVVALTIVDSATLENNHITEDSLVLVVVRDPDTNATHPNVVSTPTQRIPINLFSELNTIYRSNDKNQQKLISSDQESQNFTHNPIVYAVDALMSKKLGASELLESESMLYNAEIKLIKDGISYHKVENQIDLVPHYISMVNILVQIQEGASGIPSRTASYRYLIWTRVEDFLRSFKEKDPILISKELDPFKYCLHGMCISTSTNVLINLLTP